jgi:S1-C subfamily serine protease
MRSRTTASSRPRARGLVALGAAAALAACASTRPAQAPVVVTLPVATPTTQVVVANAAALRAGIVSVRITGQDWNARAPWEKQPPWTRTVTGLVVPNHRILVASTAFGNHLLVEAQKLGSEARTVARVALVDQEGPLALVEVDDPAFWEGLAPLPLAKQAPTEGAVTIHRWQRSGLFDSYPGTVRQVRAGRHGLSQTTLLTLEVATGAEGLGDSEVVVADGRVAGLVTGRSGDTFAALAAPVLAQFLDGAASGDWRGFARAGLSWEDLTNPALREALGLAPGETGIRLLRVAPNGSAGGVLERGDVLLEVAGSKLDATGRYDHPLYGRMLFAQLFTDGRRPGDTLKVKVLRDGRRLELALPLRRMLPEQEKVPPYLYGHGPGYVIVGGLVFQELTRPYLAAYGDWARRAPPRLLIALDREGAVPDPESPRIVVLASVLPDAANLGYQDLRDLIVQKVNGRPIGSLEQLRQALASPPGPYHVIELLPGQAARRLVVGVEEARAAVARLHEAYGVDHMDSAEAGADGEPAAAAAR